MTAPGPYVWIVAVRAADNGAQAQLRRRRVALRAVVDGETPVSARSLTLAAACNDTQVTLEVWPDGLPFADWVRLRWEQSAVMRAALQAASPVLTDRTAATDAADRLGALYEAARRNGADRVQTLLTVCRDVTWMISAATIADLTRDFGPADPDGWRGPSPTDDRDHAPRAWELSRASRPDSKLLVIGAGHGRWLAVRGGELRTFASTDELVNGVGLGDELVQLTSTTAAADLQADLSQRLAALDDRWWLTPPGQQSIGRLRALRNTDDDGSLPFDDSDLPDVTGSFCDLGHSDGGALGPAHTDPRQWVAYLTRRLPSGLCGPDIRPVKRRLPDLDRPPILTIRRPVSPYRISDAAREGQAGPPRRKPNIADGASARST